MPHNAILYALHLLLVIVEILIWADIIISFIPPIRDSKLGGAVSFLTDPVLTPIRNIINKSPLGGSGMMLDFSPFFALLIIQFIQSLIGF